MPQFSQELFQKQRASEIEDETTILEPVPSTRGKATARQCPPPMQPAFAAAASTRAVDGKHQQLHKEFMEFQRWRLQQDNRVLELLPKARLARSPAIFDGTMDTVSAYGAEDALESAQLGNFCGMPEVNAISIQRPMLAKRNTQLELL